MEIKDPVAIFTAEGFKMLIEALQGKKVDLSAFAGEPTEKEVDSFLEGYTEYTQGRPNRTPEKDYKIVFDILRAAKEPLHMSEIRKQLAENGVHRDPKSYSSLMLSAMKRYPIEKTDYGTYGVKPEYMDEDIFGGNEDE